MGALCVHIMDNVSCAVRCSDTKDILSFYRRSLQEVNRPIQGSSYRAGEVDSKCEEGTLAAPYFISALQCSFCQR